MIHSGNRWAIAIFNFLLFTSYVLVTDDFQVAAQTATTNEGHKIEIILKPEKEVVMLGEPTFLLFEVKNYSAQDLCVWEGGDYRNRLGRPNSFKVTVARDDGKAVPQPEAAGSDGLGVNCERIPANGSHVLKIFLPHWAIFETTGSYMVNVTKRLAIQIYLIWEQRRSMESASYVQADVGTHIKVVPGDENKLGEIIGHLGNAMLDINDSEATNAAQALAYINDKRVIRYFAQALEKFNGVRFIDFEKRDQYQISLQAIYALSRFNDDSALAALDAVINSPSEDIRENVATVLGRMRHPKARNLLLKMLKDENDDVRKAAQESLKMQRSEWHIRGRNLTTACTRLATRRLSSSAEGPAGG
jgi:hypothetical protein